jgi:hypothetical protein
MVTIIVNDQEKTSNLQQQKKKEGVIAEDE